MRKTIQLMILLVVTAYAEFTRSGEIVTDSTTELMWQDQNYTAEEETAYNNNNEEGKVLYWENAISYCENLELGGHSDWRLPNLNELKSIVDRSKSNPAIVNGFANTSSNYYWSSTTLADFNDNAWIVYFYNGYVNVYYKDNSHYVRCVRAGE